MRDIQLAMTKDDIYSLINRRRRQILVHSVIYYKLNDNLVSDYTWSSWGKELVELQKKYPDISDEVPYANAFQDFDPSTGYSLPLDDPWAVSKAVYLLKIGRNKNGTC